MLLGLIYGQLVSDRIPLWLTARNGGTWKPEYRLHALWLTSFILMPIGLGLVGAALQYRLHWMVFALGQVFVTIGSLVSIPVTVKYVSTSLRPRKLNNAFNISIQERDKATDSEQLHCRMLQISYHRGNNPRQLDASIPRPFYQLLYQSVDSQSYHRLGIRDDGILHDFRILLPNHLDVEGPCSSPMDTVWHGL